MNYGIIVWVAVGALAGWLATILDRRHSWRARIRSVAIGTVGAVAGGILGRDGVATRGFFGADSDNGGVLGTAFVALLGAGALLGIVKLFSAGNRRALDRES